MRSLFQLSQASDQSFGCYGLPVLPLSAVFICFSFISIDLGLLVSPLWLSLVVPCDFKKDGIKFNRIFSVRGPDRMS